MDTTPLQDKARELTAAGASYALVTVVRAMAPTSVYVGAQAIVLADGTLHGWIGGGCTKGVVIGVAQSTIASGQPRLVRISNDTLLPEADVEQFTMACASNGSVELFIQPYGAQGVLCVLGSTPAADEARFLARRLRIGLTNAPDDARIVLVATQGQGDEEALEAALRGAAARVLMISSRRKADRLRSVMRMRGLDELQLARLQAPAGPDAGAKTPDEIALLAIVGVMSWLRGREAKPARAAIPLPAVAPAPGQFINPVCGMAVSTTDALHTETHENVAYYFCCDGCWMTFKQDPAKYAAIHLGS